MLKKLEKKGNSYYLLIQKAWLELIEADPNKEINVDIKEGSIIITPVKD